MTLTSDGSPQHAVPHDAQELHDRTHVYLSSVAPTLDSIENLLASWNRFREVSSAAGKVPEGSSLRSVRIDPFTVLKSPPHISEAEIDRAVKRLTAKELKALHDEFELTCVDDFVYVNSDEGDEADAATSAQAATRTVHFADEAEGDREKGEDHDNGSGGTYGAGAVQWERAGERTSSALGAASPPPAAKATAALADMSATSRATALFEGNTVTVDALRATVGGGGCGSGASSSHFLASDADPLMPSDDAQTPPVISLEEMSPSSIAAVAAARGEATNDDASGPSSSRLAATFSAAANSASDLPAGCTVELEYRTDHWIPSSTRRALQGEAGASITVTTAAMHTGTMHAMNMECSAAPAAENAAASTTESDEDEDEIRSFTTFSRMALANHARRLGSRQAEEGASPHPTALQRAWTVHESKTTGTEAYRDADTPRVTNRPVASATTAPSTTPLSSQPGGTAKADLARERNAFVRMRVRDVLLANRVRAMDTSVLGAAFFAKMDTAWNAAADQTTPVLQRLDELLCESSALLHTLEVMDHQAYRERVMDPTQYLCVPRYSVSCAVADCHTPFSATVTRVMCGRCGQFFCPKCCAERGVGPDVKCEGQRYSLGWEPLCRVCYQMCRESQQRVVEERNHVLMITNQPSNGGHAGEAADEERNACHAAAGELSLKQAVLFGAYCDEHRCLSDGLPPFYVIQRSANETVSFWDILGYHFAKTQGTLRRGWQNAGNLATQAVNSAAQMMSRRKSTLR
ncbi:hypothetical protein conserved [Leishmania donovani]|uniref:Hypothetical_protein_conserved n=1 Tax=Leishmania donovani TaxID=5661 RepID=A0A504XHW5_LEIDO|nr:hypothetical protein CGC20_34800 [Leishmania donovani]CAJ1991836.1 hypothetical protein conserved [Leishmania donovani]VDZ47675.1 hypothetical_protein_conserved [Leishmania donovani]